ncbi:chemotaxis protein MotB [Balneicella halophila]|uniref:Chemotaxis protein MotB n=1 Tax=Balneicella halophila TaxID=1537566 RepID=A0A7L4UNK6_BALHA|nr:flagellar motor protein MotB [Balneicella halophila]PVX50695.1 chemotaxis protein MotB [Balneicella halophila]
MKRFFLILLLGGLVASCGVSKKDFEAYKMQKEQELEECNSEMFRSANEVAGLRADKTQLETQIATLERSNKSLQDALNNCINKGGTNIEKLVEEIGTSNKYIRELIATNNRKDSLNRALSNNLKRSLSDVSDEDIEISVKKGVVFISLSDKMLFKSGRYELNSNAKVVLAKIGKIVNDYQSYDVLIEGHTDSKPISTACLKDNWDLSAMRATTIARYMHDDLEIDPSRITAGARSEYVPKASNATPEGRSLNRRTEIIILPKLDEFIKLMEQSTGEKMN